MRTDEEDKTSESADYGPALPPSFAKPAVIGPVLPPGKIRVNDSFPWPLHMVYRCLSSQFTISLPHLAETTTGTHSCMPRFEKKNGVSRQPEQLLLCSSTPNQ